MKSKILFIGDDIRHTTGVSRILKEVILDIANRYNIIQLACGNSSKEHSITDVSQSVCKIRNLDECSVKLYETKNYGNLDQLKNILFSEQPHVIFLMTDPHRYKWFFEAENEIRNFCPIMYYHVWDNLPYPQFLKPIYKSCDWIGCISKLTYDCVDQVYSDHKNYCHIPHGVNTNIFFKQSNEQIKKNRISFLGKDFKFVLFYNNVNQKRKQLGNLIDGFYLFHKNLNESQKNDVALLLHTNPISASGIDVNTLLDDLYPDLPVFISSEKVEENVLNNMYNLSHCTITCSSMEGFGLSTLESVATQTPIIISYTGGLKDQFNKNWSEKIVPDLQILTGSQNTPYINSDISSSKNISQAIKRMYLRIIGNQIDFKSIDDFLNENNFKSNLMSNSIADSIDQTLSSFKSGSQLRFVKIN